MAAKSRPVPANWRASLPLSNKTMHAEILATLAEREARSRATAAKYSEGPLANVIAEHRHDAAAEAFKEARRIVTRAAARMNALQLSGDLYPTVGLVRRADEV